MFPFYDDVIAPLIAASGAKRILEIGIRRGATTAQLLRRLGPGVEVHAIDPVPDFDVAELARSAPGRYVVHEATSHEVLPSLGAFDVALVDGDHNWFTVYHELRMLADGARADGTDLPIFVLHDVAWPYGRRDLYYSPDRIPAEFRHEYARLGLQPGRKGVATNGGMNASFDNATEEGGARNGVMTAIDDFVAECDEPLRVVVLPIYFGLAIVASESRLARSPEVVRLLDWLESNDGKNRLLELSESIRLRAVTHQQNALARAGAHTERLAMQYVELLRESSTRDDDAAAARLDRLVPVLDAVRASATPGDIVLWNAREVDATFTRGYLDAYDLDRARFVALDERTAVEITVERVALLYIGDPAARGTSTALADLEARLAPDGIVLTADATRLASAPATSVLRPSGRNPALSVVVVGYDMARELPRTLRSLSARYQRDIDPGDYEVVLVDNGSPQLLDESEFADFEGDLRIERIDPAPPSPAHAANVGIGLARGDLIGLVIDGARMASPRLLAGARDAASLVPKPVVTTLAWHLGPVLHMDAAAAGYDASREDTLLAQTEWEKDGYRLFGVSTLAASSNRGWFGRLGECNSLFLTRATWDDLDGLDERFVMPGGGRCNHDLYRRACLLDGAQVVMLLGEGTFHQIHGGAATGKRFAKADADAEYEALRGAPFAPPVVPRLYFGSIPPAAVPVLEHSVRWLVADLARGQATR